MCDELGVVDCECCLVGDGFEVVRLDVVEWVGGRVRDYE